MKLLIDDLFECSNIIEKFIFSKVFCIQVNFNHIDEMYEKLNKIYI